MKFKELCELVSLRLSEEWNGDDVSFGAIEMQKKAIIGYKEEQDRMLLKIEAVISSLSDKELNENIPSWYESPASAVFHEVWGLAGAAEWFCEKYSDSSSCKIIGERIYFLVDGKMKIMPQRIGRDRREQLIRALLLLSPEERLDKDFHEVYMLDGTRVTVFREGLTKKGQECIIFRRYIIPRYSFEEQAARGTIPENAIGLFEAMVRCGFNVVFCGSVRSAKTTFLSTWQSYEDPDLEGVMVETDPEIPIHSFMPDSPVVQLLADGERLRVISKNLMRSDADYFILAEARDGTALDTAVRIAKKGTRRMKLTYHSRDAVDFAYDSAVEIVRSFGGNPGETALRVAGCFDYVFHFSVIRGTGLKKLRTIYEMSAGEKVHMKEICRYDIREDRWEWSNHISDEKKMIAMEEDTEAFFKFSGILEQLSGTEQGGRAGKQNELS